MDSSPVKVKVNRRGSTLSFHDNERSCRKRLNFGPPQKPSKLSKNPCLRIVLLKHNYIKLILSETSKKMQR